MTADTFYRYGTLFAFAFCFIVFCALAGQAQSAQLPQQCRCKQAFPTVEAAEEMAVKRYENERYSLTPYKCDYCPDYHLTTEKK